MDIYEAYIASSNNSRKQHIDNVTAKVKFPLENANHFYNIEIIGSFDFSDSGRFINAKEIIKNDDLFIYLILFHLVLIMTALKIYILMKVMLDSIVIYLCSY
jgi:hypothetical protein